MRTRLRQLRAESGYTLTELLAVMVVLGIVLGALTILFVSGSRAEIRANQEFQAQQNARLALDRMRRELHCASAVSAPSGTPTTTITVTLPAGCQGADTVVTYATANVSTDRYQMTRQGGDGSTWGDTVTVADYFTNDDVFTYTAPGSGTLGVLSVDFPVNLDPTDPNRLWRLEDDIVLRNTTRL